MAHRPTGEYILKLGPVVASTTKGWLRVRGVRVCVGFTIYDALCLPCRWEWMVCLPLGMWLVCDCQSLERRVQREWCDPSVSGMMSMTPFIMSKSLPSIKLKINRKGSLAPTRHNVSPARSSPMIRSQTGRSLISLYNMWSHFLPNKTGRARAAYIPPQNRSSATERALAPVKTQSSLNQLRCQERHQQGEARAQPQSVLCVE